MLEMLFRSHAEVKTLGVVLFEDGLHLREIARRAGISPYESKRELDNLCQIGLLNSKRLGNQVFFYKNDSCSFLKDVRSLYQKTEGGFGLLKETLGGFEEINYAFIFGSTAANKDKRHSDIDLMIIGDAEDHLVSKAIFKVQMQTKKEINFIIWSNADFNKKIAEKNNFLKNITSNKVIWLRGDQHEFIRLTEKRFNKKNRAG